MESFVQEVIHETKGTGIGNSVVVASGMMMMREEDKGKG